MSSAPADARILRSVRRILDATPLCAIATKGDRGPHAHTAFFVVDSRFDLFFLSDPGSLHSRNLARDPRACAGVFDSRQQRGGDDRGVQLFGRCAPARTASIGCACSG